jgi:signal transduction histidine kinase
VNVLSLARETKERWVANGYPAFPLWIPLVIDSGALATAVVSVVQRGGTDDLLPAGLLVLLALSPWLFELRGRVAPWPLFWFVTGGATAVLMVRYPVDYDFAPFLLVLMVGHVAACLPMWRSLQVLGLTMLGGGVLTLADPDALPRAAAAIWVAGVVGGWDIGFILRYQQLRLQDQEREHVVRERQVALEERQRVAREVHDLVAHSLSVTMLHLTAARRDLEDCARDGVDLGDAIAALQDAERVGRRAMVDIRSTVGLLGQDPAGATAPPAPGLADLPALVEDFRSAGLDVVCEVVGDTSEVPSSTALGIYRIVQESLANVAKHAPRSAASVSLDLDRDPGVLVVRNATPRGLRTADSGGGSGLRGMAERADLLGARLVAGPEGGEWRVRLTLPRGDTAPRPGGHGLVCPLPRLSASWRRAAPEAT